MAHQPNRGEFQQVSSHGGGLGELGAALGAAAGAAAGGIIIGGAVSMGLLPYRAPSNGIITGYGGQYKVYGGQMVPAGFNFEPLQIGVNMWRWLSLSPYNSYNGYYNNGYNNNGYYNNYPRW